MIEPGEQVAVDEELLAEQSDQIGQGPAIRSPQLKIAEEQHGDQGGPDLDLQGIGAGADEAFDPQVLFQGAICQRSR